MVFKRSEESQRLCRDYAALIKDEDLKHNIYRTVWLSLGIFSFMALMLVIQTLRMDKNLRMHPAKLISFICILEAGYICISFIMSPHVTAGSFICYLQLDRMLSYWTFSPGYEDAIEIRFLIWVSTFQLYFFHTASLIANMCLCHDLIKSLRSPFDMAGRRIKYYIIVTLASSALIVLFLMSGLKKEQDPPEINRLRVFIETDCKT